MGGWVVEVERWVGMDEAHGPTYLVDEDLVGQPCGFLFPFLGAVAFLLCGGEGGGGGGGWETPAATGEQGGEGGRGGGKAGATPAQGREERGVGVRGGG